MKYLRMLTLAAVAAAAFIAFAIAGTASATVLCTTTTTPCSAKLNKGSELHAQLEKGTKAIFDTQLKTAECNESAMKLTTKTTGGANETVVATIDELSFEECNCDVVVLKNGSIEIHHIAGTDNGTLILSGLELTKECNIIGSVHCTFASKTTHMGTLTGGHPATMDVNATLQKVGGGVLCPPHTIWTGAYEITNHTTLHVEPR